jgi:hypothetical protein
MLCLVLYLLSVIRQTTNCYHFPKKNKMSYEVLARKCAEIMIDALKKADVQISAVGNVFPEIAGKVREDLPVNKWLEMCQKWLSVPGPAAATAAVAAASPATAAAAAAASVKPPAAAAAAAPVAMDDDKKDKKTLSGKKRKNHPTKEPKSRGGTDLGASADAPPSSSDDDKTSSSRRGRRPALSEEEKKARRAAACKAYRARLAAQKAAESAAKAAAIKATVESFKAKVKENAAAAAVAPVASAAPAAAESKAPKKLAVAAAAAAAAAAQKPKASKKPAAAAVDAAVADDDDAATVYEDDDKDGNKSEDIDGDEDEDDDIDTESAAWQIYHNHMEKLRPQNCIVCGLFSSIPCTSCMEVMLCSRPDCRKKHQAEPTCAVKQTISAKADLMLSALDESVLKEVPLKVYHSPIYPDLPEKFCCSVCQEKVKLDEKTGDYELVRCDNCLQLCVCKEAFCLERHMDTSVCKALSVNENVRAAIQLKKFDPRTNPFPTMSEYTTTTARLKKEAAFKFFADKRSR